MGLGDFLGHGVAGCIRSDQIISSAIGHNITTLFGADDPLHFWMQPSLQAAHSLRGCWGDLWLGRNGGVGVRAPQTPRHANMHPTTLVTHTLVQCETNTCHQP